MKREEMETAAYTALRIVGGVMLTQHGMQKLFGWLASPSRPAFGTQLWFGGVLELGCGTLMALGLLTRGAALLASGMMAVAYFQFHFKFDFAALHWAPVINKGEMAALNCFIFLLVCFRGGGPYSLDALIAKRSK